MLLKGAKFSVIYNVKVRGNIEVPGTVIGLDVETYPT